MAKGSALKKKCGLSEVLADFMGSDTASRPEIMKKVWAYIKKHDLQDAKKRRIINPDETLAELLGSKPIDMFKMTSKLNEHIE